VPYLDAAEAAYVLQYADRDPFRRPGGADFEALVVTVVGRDAAPRPTVVRTSGEPGVSDRWTTYGVLTKRRIHL
jgi:hypothetical protein